MLGSSVFRIWPGIAQGERNKKVRMNSFVLLVFFSRVGPGFVSPLNISTGMVYGSSDAAREASLSIALAETDVAVRQWAGTSTATLTTGNAFRKTAKFPFRQSFSHFFRLICSCDEYREKAASGWVVEESRGIRKFVGKIWGARKTERNIGKGHWRQLRPAGGRRSRFLRSQTAPSPVLGPPDSENG